MFLPCQCKNPNDNLCYRLIIIEKVRYCRKYKDFPLKQHEFVAVLRHNGWEFVRQESSHQRWEKNGIRREFAWPSRGYATPIFIKTLLKKFGITLEDKKKKMDNVRLHAGANRQSELLPEDTLGGRLARARIKKGMSQMKLANLLKVPQTHVSKWERGAGGPTDFQTEMLAEIFEWEDMLKVIKPVTASIEIIQTSPLPGTIENVIVGRQSEWPDPPMRHEPEPEPKPEPEQPREKEIPDPILTPQEQPKYELGVPEPVASAFVTVQDYVNKLREENFALQERLRDLQSLEDKAKKWDLIKELMADEA